MQGSQAVLALYIGVGCSSHIFIFRFPTTFNQSVAISPRSYFLLNVLRAEEPRNQLMKHFIVAIASLLIAGSMFAKDIKIVVIPSESTIKVNGSYYGDGSAILKIKKNDFVSLECSCPGYETLNTRIYGNDERKTIEIKLKEDMLLKTDYRIFGGQ